MCELVEEMWGAVPVDEDNDDEEEEFTGGWSSGFILIAITKGIAYDCTEG